MEVRIGVENTSREVAFESAQTPDEVAAAVDAAIAKGTLLTLADERGRTVIVPGSKIAYVEIGAPTAGRIGFGS